MEIIKNNNIWHDLQFKKDTKKYKHVDDIFLIQQFFINKDPFRNKEIQYCLKKNVNNHNFKKIYLLNEKIYSQSELGLSDDEMLRIQQVNIVDRMTYKHVLDFVSSSNLSGYIVFSNSDIYLDDTIQNVFNTTLYYGRCWYAQLRIEAYTKKLFGPNSHAQDTWIFHTKCKIQNTKPFDFILGKLGCDNRVVYEVVNQNIYVFNDPNYIKTYHLHKSINRDYSMTDKLPPPYLRITPNL